MISYLLLSITGGPFCLVFNSYSRGADSLYSRQMKHQEFELVQLKVLPLTLLALSYIHSLLLLLSTIFVRTCQLNFNMNFSSSTTSRSLAAVLLVTHWS